MTDAPARPPPAVLRLGDVDVALLTREEAARRIVEAFERREKLRVAYANSNLIAYSRRQPAVRAALEDFLVLNDGVALNAAARLVHGRAFPDNLNGTDFTPHLLRRLPPGAKVFLYGGRPEVLDRAGPLLEAACNVRVAGAQDGYAPIDPARLVDAINASGAQVVLVALGNPRQELWIAERHAALDAPLCMAVGALLDFTAGEFKRAPLWVQRLRLEWLFRLAQEPRRLAKRYSVDMLYFFWVVWSRRGSTAPAARQAAPAAGAQSPPGDDSRRL
jgi:exopolysaccharide biosynthesis WecB/TagA/CpsF family protein